MGLYMKHWDCCGDDTTTNGWEPDECPYCELQDAQEQLKQLQDAVMALLSDIDSAYVEVNGEHVEPVMSMEAYNLVREMLKDQNLV